MVKIELVTAAVLSYIYGDSAGNTVPFSHFADEVVFLEMATPCACCNSAGSTVPVKQPNPRLPKAGQAKFS